MLSVFPGEFNNMHESETRAIMSYYDVRYQNRVPISHIVSKDAEHATGADLYK